MTVRCDGTETSIAECRHGGWGEHNCGHYEDVGIVCKYTPPPTPGNVPLSENTYQLLRELINQATKGQTGK